MTTLLSESLAAIQLGSEKSSKPEEESKKKKAKRKIIISDKNKRTEVG